MFGYRRPIRVIEQSIVAKNGEPADCEDGIVVTEHFAAVIDGVTAKTGTRYRGITPGRFAMETLREGVKELPPRATAPEGIAFLTYYLAERQPADMLERPAAAITLYSRRQRQLWIVGDVGYCFGDRGVNFGTASEQVAVAMRRAVLKAELLAGRTVAELRADDVGRAAITPFLERQHRFANNPAAGDLAYACLDGREVPIHLIGVVSTFPYRKVAIATDGYRMIYPTLARTEKSLADSLAADPLRIGPFGGTKALAPGASGYDDRAYVRLAI